MNSKLNSTEKVLLVVKAFLPDNRPRGILELCKDLDMKPGTVSRILNVLKEYDFIQQDVRKKYQLGEMIGKLGEAVNTSRTALLVSMIKPQLMLLNNMLNESVHLELLIENNVKLAVLLSGSKTVQPAHMRNGGRGINSSAGAKVILAFLTSDRFQLIKKTHPVLLKFRPNTITDWNALESQLKDIKKAGIAYDFDENVEGVCAVAAPIFDSDGIVFGAVAIPVPLQRKDIILKSATIKAIKKTAANISAMKMELI